MAPDPKLLERPPWSALTTTHSGFALGNDLARRYPAAIAPMAAARDFERLPECFGCSMSPGDVVGLFGPEPCRSERFTRRGSQAYRSNDLLTA